MTKKRWVPSLVTLVLLPGASGAEQTRFNRIVHQGLDGRFIDFRLKHQVATRVGSVKISIHGDGNWSVRR